LWLDCRALELPCPAGQFFLDQAKVGLNSGETFGMDYAGYARLNFETPAAIPRELVARMGEAARRR
jgi:cystathionine beta-lyase